MTEQGEQPQPQFEDFDLSDEMLAALEHAEYQTPTPVQAGIIPGALDGQDLIGQAQTGTGKTAAFAIPILEQLAPEEEISKPQALVLTPTRELASLPTVFGNIISSAASSRRSIILAVPVLVPRIPNCLTGWRQNWLSPVGVSSIYTA